MKFINILVLSVAGTAMAKGNNKSANRTLSTKAQCSEMKSLTKLTNLAANETLLEKASKNNATKADAIKAKASDAATQLSTLQANTTLMDACAQIFAVEDTKDDCKTLASLEKMSALVANQTALDAKTKSNATKADALKAKVAASADKLTTLSSNTTLTAFCSGLETKSTCSAMADLQKEVDMASNQTALDAKFKGNATKIANFQSKAEKAQTKLAAMQSNETLVSACASLKSTTGASTSTSSDSSNAAGSLQPVGAISLAAVFMAGVLLL